MSQVKYMYKGMPLYLYCKQNNLKYSNIYRILSLYKVSIPEAIERYKKYRHKILIHNGIVVKDYCKEHNLDYRVVRSRLVYLNWSFEDSVGKPKNLYPSTTKHYVHFHDEVIPLKTALRKFYIENDISKTIAMNSIFYLKNKKNISLQEAFELYCDRELKKMKIARSV